MKLNQIGKEIIWLIVMAGLTFLILKGVLWGEVKENVELALLFQDSMIDFAAHNNYLTLSPWMIILITFCVVTFFAYLVKEGLHKFKRVIPNVFLIINTAFLIFGSAIGASVLKFFRVFWEEELSYYATLEGQGQVLDNMVRISYSLMGMAIFTLLLVGYRTIMLAKSTDLAKK